MIEDSWFGRVLLIGIPLIGLAIAWYLCNNKYKQIHREEREMRRTMHRQRHGGRSRRNHFKRFDLN